MTTLPHLIIYTAINYRNLAKSLFLTFSTTYFYCRKLLENYHLLHKFRKKYILSSSHIHVSKFKWKQLTSIKTFNYLSQAFIQALLSTAVSSQRLSFLLFAKSVNLDLQIAGKCISSTLSDFKAYIVHCW